MRGSRLDDRDVSHRRDGRRMRKSQALSAALGLAAASLLLAACSPPSMDANRAEPDDSSGAPLVVPPEVPTGYRWSGPDLVGREGSAVTLRSSILIPLELDQLPVVQVCTERPDRDLCPRGDVQLLRPDGPWTTKIALSGPGAGDVSTKRFWRSFRMKVAHRTDWTAGALSG